MENTILVNKLLQELNVGFAGEVHEIGLGLNNDLLENLYSKFRQELVIELNEIDRSLELI